MVKILEIKDLTFKYGNKYIFKDLNLKIDKNKFTTILGANGSGKTTLVKLLLGEEKPNSIILFNGLVVIKENLKNIYARTGIVFENCTDLFIMDTVLDELTFPLENLQYSKKKIQNAVVNISNKFKIEHLLNKDVQKLNDNDKVLVVLASALITKPKTLIIDESLNKLDNYMKKEVLNTLKEMTDKNELTVIYLTCNAEDSLYGDNIVILNDKKALASGSKEEIYKDEELFINANLELPFIIDLSKKLQFYDLIKEDYLDAEKMVDALWK